LAASNCDSSVVQSLTVFTTRNSPCEAITCLLTCYRHQ
jgi:hypothetical protein